MAEPAQAASLWTRSANADRASDSLRESCCPRGMRSASGPVAPRDATEFVRRLRTKKAPIGLISIPPIGGTTPRKRFRLREVEGAGERSRQKCVMAASLLNVGNSEQRTEQLDGLRLREPREQDAQCD